MKRILIAGVCDEKLKGIYQTDATEKQIQEATEPRGNSICIFKEKKDGSPSASHDYFPFKSYHSNREIARAYNERNRQATIEILDETKKNVIIENVMHEQDGHYYFKIDGYDFKAYFQGNGRNKSLEIWVDDEGDFFKAHCNGTLSEEALKNACLYNNTRTLFITDITNEDYRLSPFYDYNLNLSLRDLPRDDGFIIKPFIGYFEDQKTAACVLNELYKAMENEAASVAAWYEKNKSKVQISGYWANR